MVLKEHKSHIFERLDPNEMANCIEHNIILLHYIQLDSNWYLDKYHKNQLEELIVVNDLKRY